MLKEEVEAILAEALEQHPSLFLLDLSIGQDSMIRVVLDGDHGVSVQDCILISRAIEQRLDRETLDFSLEVGSAGATAPLKLSRQYSKNIGRILSVRSGEGSFKGTLTAVSEDTIFLEWKAREPKPTGKGKITVQKKQRFAISEIEEAKVVLKF